MEIFDKVTVILSELSGMEKRVFEKLYAGSFSKKLYRMYEFESAEMI